MRYSFLLFFLSISLLKAQGPLSLNVNVEFDELTLSEAVAELSEQSGIDISYSSSFFEADKKLSLRKENIPLEEVLKFILKTSNVSYKVIGGRIVLYLPKVITLGGYVEDESTGERLIAATVFDTAQKIGVVTNEYGFYSIQVKPGTSALAVSYVGYQETIIPIKTQTEKELNLVLKARAQLEEVVVSAQPDALFFENENQVLEIGKRFVEKSPSLGGENDLVRTAQLLPGIDAAGADGFGGLQVRGGETGQNLMMLDGVTIYIPYHLLGAYSIYNPNTVRSAKVLKSAFPARYGGRLSSILDIRTREGNLYDWESQVSTSLVNVNATVEGPIKKGKGSILVATRFSPSGALFNGFFKRAYFQDTELDVSSGFYDINFKANYTFGDKDRVYLSLFNGVDNLSNSKFEEEEEEIVNADLEFVWDNTIGSFRWNHLFNEKFFSNLTLTYSDYGYSLVSFTQIEAIDPDEENELYYFANSTENNDIGAKIDFDYIPNNHHKFRFGAGVSSRNFLPEVSYFEAEDEEVQDLDVIDLESLGELEEADTFRVFESYLYLEDRILFNSNWEANIGLRISSFNHEDQLFPNLEPRFLLGYKHNAVSRWRVSATRMVQYLHLITNTALRLPNDLWLPSSDELLPQTSWQFELGYRYEFNDYWSLSTDAYYKTLNNLYTYPEATSFFGEFNEDAVDSFLVKGSGIAYGLETLLNYDREGFGGVLSYTLSKSDREFETHNLGEAYPFDFDQRHRIKLFLYKTLGAFELGLNWVYLSGSPQISILALEDGEGNSRIELNQAGEKNDLRSEPYHRLDLSFRYAFSRSRFNHQFKVGLYNIYNQQNVAYYESILDDDDVFSATSPISSLGILPSFSYKLTF